MKNNMIDWYFKPKWFEKTWIYELLLIKLFRNFCIYIYMKSFKHTKRDALRGGYFLNEYSLIGLYKYIQNTKFNEKVHAIAGLASIIIIGFYLILGLVGILPMNSAIIKFNTITNGIFFLINLYCVMLQRYNRLRIYKIIKYKNKKVKENLKWIYQN